jgi:hypothetical protein
MGVKEFLSATLGLASFGFSALNLAFLLAYVFGRTAGGVLLYYLNYKK